MRILGGILQVVFFVLLIGGSLLAAGIMANRLPLSAPPGLSTRLFTYLNTNVAETTANSPFPELRIRRYDAPPELILDVVRRALNSLRWEVVATDDAKKEMRAVVTTKLWGFKDDVVIQAQPAQPSGTLLWIRSSSRVGKGDLGANTRHVMDLVQTVDAMVPQQALIEPQASTEVGKEQKSGTSANTPAP